MEYKYLLTYELNGKFYNRKYVTLESSIEKFIDNVTMEFHGKGIGIVIINVIRLN